MAMRFLSKMRQHVSAILQRVMAGLWKVSPAPLICLKGLDKVYLILRIAPNIYLSSSTGSWDLRSATFTDNWKFLLITEKSPNIQLITEISQHQNPDPFIKLLSSIGPWKISGKLESLLKLVLIALLFFYKKKIYTKRMSVCLVQLLKQSLMTFCFCFNFQRSL